MRCSNFSDGLMFHANFVTKLRNEPVFFNACVSFSCLFLIFSRVGVALESRLPRFVYCASELHKLAVSEFIELH